MVRPMTCPSRKAGCDVRVAPLPRVPPALVTRGPELFHGGLLMPSPSHQSGPPPFLLCNKEAAPTPVCWFLSGSAEERGPG